MLRPNRLVDVLVTRIEVERQLGRNILTSWKLHTHPIRANAIDGYESHQVVDIDGAGFNNLSKNKPLWKTACYCSISLHLLS